MVPDAIIKTVLLLNPVYISLFWALIFTLPKKEKSTSKNFLGKFMIVAFVVYLSHFVFFSRQMEIYYYLDSFYTLNSLLAYPMFHIYVRLLTTGTTFSLKDHGKYLVIPSMIFVLHLAGYVMMDRQEAMHYLMHILPGKAGPEGLTLYMFVIYQLFRITFILQVLFFLYMNFRIITSYNEKLMDWFSDIEKHKLNWVLVFNALFGIASFSSIAIAVLERNMFLDYESGLVYPSLIFSSMLFALGYFGFVQSEPGWESELLSGSEAEQPDGGPPKIKGRLDRLFQNDMIFKNPDLKIWDVCNALGSNRTYISRAINREYGRNFCNHVNSYRLEYAKMLIRENDEYDNNEIAELSGFGSVNSMYRAFRYFEGKSIKEFRHENREKNSHT